MIKDTFKELWIFVSKQKKLHIMVAAILIVFGITQIERFVEKGTIVGYQVRKVKIVRPASEADIAYNAYKKSTVCKAVSGKFVGDLMKEDVVQSTFLPDRTEPRLFSSCIYKTEAKPTKVVSVALQERPSLKDAQQQIAKLKKSAEQESLNGADLAYFNKKTNYLIVQKDAKIISITVSGLKSDGPISAQELSKSVAEKLLN